MSRTGYVFLVVMLAIVVFLIMGCLNTSYQFIGWQYNPANYPKVVQWAGCHAQVAVDTSSGPETSFYMPSEHLMVVGTQLNNEVPYYAGLFILLHETGHCLQDESGWLSQQTDIVVVEQDADRRAADLACGMGLDGRKILIDTFEWVHTALGYDGDWAHGTLAQREAQAGNAHVCDLRTTEH